MNLEDVSAERGILSCICQYGKDAYLDVIDIVQPSHFVSPTNQALASVLYYILEKDVDCKIDLHKIYSAAAELGLQGQVSEKDNQYVSRIMSFKTELSNVRDFAKKVRKLAETRRIIGLLSDTAESLKKVTGIESFAEIISKAENPIIEYVNSLADKEQKISRFGDGIVEHVEDIINNPKEVNGCPIGFPIFENILGGVSNGIHLISALSGHGKSTYAMNCGVHAAGKAQIPVLYMDSELTLKNGVWQRALARVSGVDFRLINNRRLDEIQARKVRKAARLIKEFPLSFINISGMDFNEVLSIVRRWLSINIRAGKKPLILYDYFKVTDYDALKNAKEYELMGMQCSSLHDLLILHDTPAIAFVQLNRQMQVSMSHRLEWFATSVSSLQRMSDEEIVEMGGPEFGTHKLELSKNRWGELLDGGNYIAYTLNGRISTFNERGTRNDMVRLRQEQENDIPRETI